MVSRGRVFCSPRATRGRRRPSGHMSVCGCRACCERRRRAACRMRRPSAEGSRRRNYRTRASQTAAPTAALPVRSSWRRSRCREPLPVRSMPSSWRFSIVLDDPPPLGPLTVEQMIRIGFQTSAPRPHKTKNRAPCSYLIFCILSIHHKYFSLTIPYLSDSSSRGKNLQQRKDSLKWLN